MRKWWDGLSSLDKGTVAAGVWSLVCAACFFATLSYITSD